MVTEVRLVQPVLQVPQSRHDQKNNKVRKANQVKLEARAIWFQLLKQVLQVYQVCKRLKVSLDVNVLED